MSRQDYTMGWICAMTTKYVAACELLNEEYPLLSIASSHDSNAYTLDRVDDHRVVIACLPKNKYGIAFATTMAKNMLRSFESIRIELMMKIENEAPSKKHDIKLDDVIIECPVRRTRDVLSYKFGKAMQGKNFEITRGLNSFSTILLTTLN